MASSITNQELVATPLAGKGTSVLLVNKDLKELLHYGTILRSVGCRVRASLSFAEGARRLEREPYDLIVLDQGSRGFEGREVLMRAMEVDPEIPVLVLAHSYEKGCYQEAMQAGALDYIEEPLSAGEIVALLETYIAPRSGTPVNSANQVKGARRGEERINKAESNGVCFEERIS